MFTERPLTAGKGKFSFGVNYLHATWDSFEGKDLSSGDIKLYLIHQDMNQDGDEQPDLWFEGDIIRADARDRPGDEDDRRSTRTTGSASGSTSSVAVPFLDVST